MNEMYDESLRQLECARREDAGSMHESYYLRIAAVLADLAKVDALEKLVEVLKPNDSVPGVERMRTMSGPCVHDWEAVFDVGPIWTLAICTKCGYEEIFKWKQEPTQQRNDDDRSLQES